MFTGRMLILYRIVRQGQGTIIMLRLHRRFTVKRRVLKAGKVISVKGIEG